MKKGIYQTVFKRIFDFIIAFLFLLLLSPLFILLILILCLTNRGTPFFLQKRPGKNGKLFSVIKFKTMNNKKDAKGNLLADRHRLTLFGKFIRSSSLDEIPQLINVIKGEMSLIGPRPLLPEYLLLYNSVQNRRHEVKPGITGWAQVNGRNTLSWQKKFEYDVWYVDNYTFFVDLRIFAKTIKKVFISEGINSNTETIMEPFNGSN